MTLTFEPEGHAYYWNGERVPNVTSIIAHLTDLSHIPPAKLEHARQEGVHIHKMVELHFLGELKSVPEWMRGHHEALLKCIAETGFWCAFSERKVYHARLRYAGTPDLGGGFAHLRGSKDLAIIDVKRSFFGGPAIGLQTEAYRLAVNSEDGANLYRERYALQLRADGTYRLERYTDKDDEAAFLACLQQYRWRQKHYGNR